MRLPNYVWALIAIYFVASLAHFTRRSRAFRSPPLR
jgi:hypothetical protein